MKTIFGAICGDICGSAYEFHPVTSDKFPLINGFSRFTDDTVLSIALASWILNKQKPEELATCYRQWANLFPKAGYGGMFRKWLRDADMGPYGSFGNGSAMRVSAAALAAGSLEEALELARISAEPTHNHPEGIKGALATAHAIYLALHTEGSIEDIKKVIKKTIEKEYGYNLSRTTEQIRKNYKFYSTCQKSVPEAIIAFLEATSYEDCIRRVIMLKGDADTQGAIAGAIAACVWDIPPHLLQICRNKLNRASIGGACLLETADEFDSFINGGKLIF